MSRSSPSLFGRLSARWWYIWGLSLNYMGNTTAERSFYEAGVWSFGRAAYLWPDFAAAHHRRGLIRGRELGEYTAAVADLERASELAPEWPEPYLQLGLLHRFNGDGARAATALRRFVALAPAGYWRDEAERQLAAIGEDDQPPAAPVL